MRRKPAVPLKSRFCFIWPKDTQMARNPYDTKKNRSSVKKTQP